MNSEVAMTLDEQVFRRVFRFHPHAWRDENEAVAASVLMDVAEAAGRTQPSAGDKLSVQGHAMSLWLRRVIRPDLAETVASLALGTGFMIALFHLISFEVLPVIQMLRYFSEVEYAPDYFPFMWFSISNVTIVCLWIAAAIAVAVRRPGLARWLSGSVLFACIGVCVIRLGPKDLLIESVLVPLIFGAWAMLALVARVRAKLVWKTTAIVGIVLGVFMLLKMLIDGSPFYFAPAFWESLASFLLLGLVTLFLVLVTAAALGRTGFAIVGTYYAAPWAISMLAGFVCFNLNLSRAEFTIMTAIWILASAVILTLSRYMDHRVIRATDQ